MAGLPGIRAMVKVGPPLFCNVSSRGSIGLALVPTKSLAITKPLPPLPLPIRLWPCEVKVPTTVHSCFCSLTLAPMSRPWTRLAIFSPTMTS